jgi:Thioesterase-like superfamily
VVDVQSESFRGGAANVAPSPAAGAAGGPSGASAATAFERASAITRERAGGYEANVDPGWSTAHGPSGGFLTALAARALLAELDSSDARQLRWLTCMFHRKPKAGRVAIDVEILRAGRRVSDARTAVSQDDRAILTALCAVSVRELAGAGEWDAGSPGLEPPPAWEPAVIGDVRRMADAGQWLLLGSDYPPINRQALIAPRYGSGRYAGHQTAGRPPEAGGWIYMPGQVIDTAYLVLLADWWWPAAFGPIEEPARAPTIGFALDLRADLPRGGFAPQPVLARHVAKTASCGMVDEDAELRLADGTLLARAHQLSLFVPVERSGTSSGGPCAA